MAEEGTNTGEEEPRSRRKKIRDARYKGASSWEVALERFAVDEAARAPVHEHGDVC